MQRSVGQLLWCMKRLSKIATGLNSEPYEIIESSFSSIYLDMLFLYCFKISILFSAAASERWNFNATGFGVLIGVFRILLISGRNQCGVSKIFLI